jgi:predicted Zn-dependent peptidase
MVATEKLEVFLGIVTEFLSRPIIQIGSHRNEKMRAVLGRLMSSMSMAEGMREMSNHLFKGDSRFTWGDLGGYLGVSAVDVRNWLLEPLTRGYVEATIVGDVPEDELQRVMARTLASVGPRAREKVVPPDVKPVRVSAPAGFQRIEFVGEQHQAVVFGTWPIVATLDTRDKAALFVLAKILEQRINRRVRDDLGLAYSPVANFSAYSGFPDFSLIRAMVDCSPGEAANIAKLVDGIGADLATNGVTEGEFIGSRGILSSQVRRALLENDFKVSLLERAQERPESIDEALGLRSGIIDTVTLEEVDRWARTVLPASNSRTAAIVPKPFIGIFQAQP